MLLHLYEAAPLSVDPDQVTARLEAEAQEILLNLLSLGQDDPHAITLALYGGAPAALFGLANAYRTIVPNAQPVISYYTRLGKATFQRMTVPADELDDFFSQPRSGILGIVLAIRAPFARSRFETEAGLHVMEDDKNKNAHPILVDASPLSASSYRPPKDVEFRIGLAGQRRRTYTLERGEADDPLSGKAYRWPGRAMEQALSAAVEDHLRRRIEAILR